jgi:hypothetical protein
VLRDSSFHRLRSESDRASLSESPSPVPAGQEYMKEEWERKYRAALMEHNPYKAVVLRINETESTSDERERLDTERFAQSLTRLAICSQLWCLLLPRGPVRVTKGSYPHNSRVANFLCTLRP